MRAWIYVGLYLGDSQVWDLEDVEIDDGTPEDKIEEVAKEKWAQEYGGVDRLVAFYGLLSYSRDEEEDE